jgi:hypothetical protein
MKNFSNNKTIFYTYQVTEDFNRVDSEGTPEISSVSFRFKIIPHLPKGDDTFNDQYIPPIDKDFSFYRRRTRLCLRSHNKELQALEHFIESTINSYSWFLKKFCDRWVEVNKDSNTDSNEWNFVTCGEWWDLDKAILDSFVQARFIFKNDHYVDENKNKYFNTKTHTNNYILYHI